MRPQLKDTPSPHRKQKRKNKQEKILQCITEECEMKTKMVTLLKEDLHVFIYEMGSGEGNPTPAFCCKVKLKELCRTKGTQIRKRCACLCGENPFRLCRLPSIVTYTTLPYFSGFQQIVQASFHICVAATTYLKGCRVSMQM